MPLFEFELRPVEEITPWGEGAGRNLSWFALTDGYFRVRAGGDTLFEYTDAVVSHFGLPRREANYQIAAFARDLLGSVAAGVAPLPADVERLASDWERLMELVRRFPEEAEAWRWLGERSPWTSYLAAAPRVQFVRMGDVVRIHWDNRECTIDGLPAWTAQYGVHAMAPDAFLAESRDFAARLLGAMEERIAGIEHGVLRPQVPVDAASLRAQHETWRRELESYFRDYEPDVPWGEAEAALRAIGAW